jgi:hypothetical protein
LTAPRDFTGHTFPTGPLLSPVQRIVLRPVSDGPGPSHLIAIGEYLLVVDPWSAEITRYLAADMDAPPHIVSMPRQFAPWRSVAVPGGIALVGEPVGYGGAGGYCLECRYAMTITRELVAAMPRRGESAFPITPYRAPALSASGRDAPTPPFAVGGPNAVIAGVRHAGILYGERSLLWWSEIDGEVPGPGWGGRVTASQYVGIFDRGSHEPAAIIRIQTAAYASMSADSAMPDPLLLVKPAFEYVAGIDQTLWVMAAEPGAEPCFVLRAYPLDGLIAGARATISLIGPEEAIDRNDSTHIGAATQSASKIVAPMGPRANWFAAARDRLRKQATHEWVYPAGAAERPCGGLNRGPVGAGEDGALGSGEGFSAPVRDKIDEAGGAEWMRPRHLIGVPTGTALRGVPYSIGGFDLTGSFDARLASGYPGSGHPPPPIGHIREGLEWDGAEANYPLGIDCSALVARIFDIGVRSTAEMVAPKPVVLKDGRTIHVPVGPDHACAEPVRHLDHILPGDEFLRDGHIVIYSGDMTIAGGRALRVFEASSRTGRVCESVYDPSFFDGWWILRIRLTGASDCPRWLEAAFKT